MTHIIGAAAGAAVPPRGRPRSEEADRAITSAALQVLAEDGIAAFSMEAVAHRAGVAKSTIYRRFTGAHDLLADALSTLNDGLVEPPEGASTREALVTIVEAIRVRAVEGATDRCLPQLLSPAHARPELVEIYYDRVVEVRRSRARRVIERGVTLGDIRADVDVELLVSMFTAPMVAMVMMIPPSRRVADATTASAIVDVLLAGVAGSPATATTS